MDQFKSELIPIPLPTEIPEPPSLDHLPLDVLHSATVEMLIQQNDDLSSRLKVNIRRNSQQEQKILETKKKIDELERKNENLKAQNEIVKEKEQIWMRQKEEQGRKMESSHKEMDLLQLRYNELYTTSQQKQKELHKQVIDKNSTIEKLQRKIHIFKSVRIKAKDRLRNFLLQAAQSMHHGQSVAHKTQGQNKLLKRQFEMLSQEIGQKEEAFREHLENVKRISQEKLSELQQINIELKHTEKLQLEKYASLKKEFDQLYTEFSEEKKNRARVSSLSRELGEIKNEKVSDKRKYLEIIKKLEEARSYEKEKLEKIEHTNKSLQVQVSEQKDLVHSCENQILELRKDNTEMGHQLERLQELWLDTQNKLEKEQLKRKTLEKINRELSQDSQDSKIVQSIERAQEQENTTTAKPATKESKINSKLTEVYASQYGSMDKQPEL